MHARHAWAIVETRVYRRMHSLLRDAQENALMLAVTGDAGCGKSEAVRRCACCTTLFFSYTLMGVYV